MARNSKAVPQARGALDSFKYEVANEMGVNLKQGYNGDLTSKEAGSVGGEMVKKMIQSQEQQMGGTATTNTTATNTIPTKPGNF